MREKYFVFHLINKMKENREETSNVTRYLIPDKAGLLRHDC